MPWPDRPVDRVDQVVVHLAAPFLVGGGDEGLSESGRAAIVDAEHRIAAVGQPLVDGIEAPVVAQIRAAVDHQHHRQSCRRRLARRQRQIAVEPKPVARRNDHRLHLLQRHVGERLALPEQAAHLPRLAIEQRVFAALGVALVKHRRKPIVGAAVDDLDVTCPVSGEIGKILPRTGIDRMPAHALPVGAGGERDAPVEIEVDIRDVGLIVGCEQESLPARHVDGEQRRLVAAAGVEHVQRLAVGAEVLRLGRCRDRRSAPL